MKLARAIRAVRNTLKISRLELAQRTGYSFWTITSYEQGKRNPSLRFLETLEAVRKDPALRRAAVARKNAAVPRVPLLLALESRLRAVERRHAALEMRVAALEARAGSRRR